jgi:hypothetical protein
LEEQCKADIELSFHKLLPNSNEFSELHCSGKKCLSSSSRVILPLSESGDFTPVVIESFLAKEPLRRGELVSQCLKPYSLKQLKTLLVIWILTEFLLWFW